MTGPASDTGNGDELEEVKGDPIGRAAIEERFVAGAALSAFRARVRDASVRIARPEEPS